MRIIFLILVISCVAWQISAQDDEPRPVLSRGLLKRGPQQRGKLTTTTTTQAPQEDIEYEDEAEYPADEAQEPATEAPPSSTEGKKLVGGGVRPFRSNTDLLETLKRRRAQAAEAKLRGHSSQPAPEASQPAASETLPEPVKSSFNKKRFNNSPAKEITNEEAPAPVPKPSRGRFGRPSTRSVVLQPQSAEEQDVAPPPRNSRTFRRGN